MDIQILLGATLGILLMFIGVSLGGVCFWLVNQGAYTFMEVQKMLWERVNK